MAFYSNLEVISTHTSNGADLWTFIICCLVVIAVILFFLFYFNRVAARIFTFVVNQYLWKRHAAYIQLDSVQVTLLGARILFRNFQYHSTDLSFSVVKGHITLQYWLFNIQRATSFTTDDSKLPCRLVCSVEGFEGFIYNNIAFYERLKTILGLEIEPTPHQRPMAPFSMNGSTPSAYDPENQALSESSLLQRLLPIQIECTTAAIIVGNSQLPSSLVLKTCQASGTLNTGRPRTPLDYYKVTLDLVLLKSQVSVEPNEHYTKDEHEDLSRVGPQQYTFSWWKAMHQWTRWVFSLEPNLRSIKNKHYEEQQQQQSEPRYRQSFREDYAKVESIVECSQVGLCYYADIPGPVTSATTTDYSGIGVDIGNGGLPPEWGVRFSLWNAIINYGPWTDKQRTPLQNYFIPNPHRTNTPTSRLSPGEIRIPTSFEVLVDFMTDGKLRIPTKEVSKNWKFTGDMPNLDTDKDGYYIRPYGWFDIKFKEGSSLKAVAPLVTGNDGYLGTMDVDLKDIDVTTSVNFARLARSNGFKLHVDVPFPLIWNEHRTWLVDAKAYNAELYLLRDHIHLLQDLVKDWIALPPTDLLHFVPITYQLQFDVFKANIFLCLNEHNIINYPNSIDDNAFAAVDVNKIHFGLSVPMLTYQPEVISVSYEVQLDNVHGGVSVQSSHTWSSFLREEDAELGSCKSISVQGCYEAYTTVDVLRHIESASIHLKLQGAVLKLFGSVVRYIIIFRDNYIGNSQHFCTIDEYRQRRANPDDYMKMKKKEMDAKTLSDPFELYLLCDVDDIALILPENLYESSRYSQLEFREFQLELRNLDIYMDMYITISPITWTRESHPNPTTRHRHSKMKNARDPGNYFYIDGANIHTHRLFGPHPTTSTYLCQWEFDVGNVKGEIKPSFLMGLSSFAKTFVYNFIDEDNAVSLDLAMQPSSPDVIFASLQVRQVDVYLMTQNSSTQIQLHSGLRLDFDNLINDKYNQHISVQVPGIAVTCLANQDQDAQQKNNDYTWVEVASIKSGLNVTLFRHIKDWEQYRISQQNFIRRHDQLTRRCTHLYEGDGTTTGIPNVDDHHVGVLYAPPFRPNPTENHPDIHHNKSSFGTTPSTLDDTRSSLSGDGDDGECSMVSYSNQWLILPDSMNSETRQFRHSTETDSTESIASNKDSFCTAESEDDIYTRTNLSNGEEASSDTTSDIDGEDEYNYNDINTIETTSHPGYTNMSIPPSITYSRYLDRYAVKRATQSVGRGQAFFHPYIPPPKPSFIPQKTKIDQQDWPLGNDGGDFFNGFQAEADLNLPSDTAHKSNNDKRNDVVTTLVLEATHPMKILVTPILIKVVQEMTEIINKDDWDLESMLDSSQIEYVGQLTRYLTDKFISTRFVVWLPSTHLHFIQNVMIPADLPSYKHAQHHLQTLYDNENDMLCTADIFLDDFKIIAGLTFQDYAFGLKQTSVAESKLVLEESRVHLNIGNLGCKVKYISDCYENRRHVMFGIPYSRQYVHRDSGRSNTSPRFGASDSDDSSFDQQSANELVVLDVGLNKLCCKWLGARKPNYLDFGVNELSSIIITESVEILLGAVYLWLVFVDDLRCIIKRFQDRRSRQNQVFIHHLSKFSNDNMKISRDPQFLTIPTSMGPRIGPKNFRSDVGWKLLARMRQCLRMMPSTDREKLQYRLTSGGAIEHVDSIGLYRQVIQAFSDWRSWEIHNKDIRSCRLFTAIFLQQQNIGGDSTNISDSDDTSIAANSSSQNPNMGHTNDMATFLMTSMNHANIKVNRFNFCIYEEEPDIDDNHISIGSLEFAIDTVYKLSELGNSVKDTAAPLPTSEGYLDAVTKLEIGLIDVSINPTVLAFARHMLTVQWVFTNKLKSLSQPSSAQFGRDNSTYYVDQSATTSTTTTTTTTTNDQQPVFDVHLLLSRIDVVIHVLTRIRQVRISAWAQKLAMKNNIHSLCGSIVFSNPKLSPATRSENDLDTNNSGKPSSNKASRKQGSQTGRIIMNVSGGVDSFDTGFYELVSCGHQWTSCSTDSNNNKYEATRQDSKRIHTKLLTLTVYDAKINSTLYQPSKIYKKQKSATKNSSNREILKTFASVGAFDMDAPQSLLRLYSFVEEWRIDQGQRYHFMFQNLLNEWEEQRRLTDLAASSNQTNGASNNVDGQKPSPRHWYDIKIQLLLSKFVVKADLLQSLGIKFSIDDLLVLVDGTQQQTGVSLPDISYAFQVSKQAVEFITRAGNNTNVDPQLLHLTNTSAFNLPGVRSSGTLTQVMELSSGNYGHQLQSSISVDFVALSLDVRMIDSLLTAQNLLGKEINEFIEALSYARKSCHQPVAPSPTISSPLSPSFKYSIGFSLDGLRIKAASPTANGLFESNVLEALISNHSSSTPNQPLLWNISGNNFALSLSHGGSLSELDDGKRLDRLAYIVVDFGLQNQPIQDDTNITDQQLISHNIKISKVQAVMQPKALGKLAEMYIYYDLELKKKKEIKREEMEQLAANTKRIVASLQTDTKINEQNIHDILQGKYLLLVVENLGVAIPLSDLTDDALSSPTPTSIGDKFNDQQQQYHSHHHHHHHHHHAALLFTFSSLQFTTESFTATTATIENTALRFVKHFDQSNELHFLATNRSCMNQIRLPSIKCIMDTKFETKDRKLNVNIDAKARGFEVDLDGTIVDHLNRLFTIYGQGMDRVNTFARETNGDASIGNNITPTTTGQQPPSASDLIHLGVEGFFECGASVLRLHPKRQGCDFGRKQRKTTTRRSTRGHENDTADDEGRELNEGFGIAIIKLPGLDAELKYQTPIGALAYLSDSPQLFHTDILIRESSNILHPSLVQFLREVVSGLKFGMQLSTERKAIVPASPKKTTACNTSASIILRLSKTKLELSCQPTSKVVCSLGWNTGEFVLNSVFNGLARTTSCFGSLRSISTVIKHHFSPQSCLTTNIDLVTFNIALTPKLGDIPICDSISIIVKIPSIQGDISMRHLQDLLILNSCWFAQPVDKSQLRQHLQQQTNGKQYSGTFPFASYLILVLDSVTFSVDMGQAIGKIYVTPRNLSLQTHMIPTVSQGIGLSLDDISITSEGRLTGEAKVYRIILHGKSSTSTVGQICRGHLYLEIDGLQAKFTYEYQNILELLQEPIQATAIINSSNSSENESSDLHHQLKLAVHLGRSIATVSVKTVPVIIVMHQRFMELLEKKRNEARIVYFSWMGSKHGVEHNRTQTSRAASSTSRPKGTSAIGSNQQQRQRQWLCSMVKIFAEGVQLIVYPSQFQDGDNVEFHAMRMEGSLQQTPEAINDGIQRHLLLSIGKATLLKNVPGQKIMKKRQQQLDHIITTKEKQAMGVNDDLTDLNEAREQNGGSKGMHMKEVGISIFTLPVTKLVMDSTQVIRTVHHTFAVNFKDRVQLSLNIGQLKYLQDLVGTFMDQMSRALKTVHSASVSRTLDNMEQHQDEGMHGDDVASLDSAIGVGDLNIGQQQQKQPQPAPKCSEAIDDNNDSMEKSTNKLTYMTNDVIHFNPQIRQMGDATPPVEWILGLKRHRIPELVHEKLTLQVDQMVQTVWDFYQAHTHEH